MLDRVRNRIKKTAQFAQRHHTLVACAATSVITWKFTRGVTFKEAAEEWGPFVYEVGRDNEHLLLQNRVFLDFINLKGLGEELQQHILSMRD